MKILHSYQPQSSDTHPEIDKFLMISFRRMASWQKANLVNEATKGIWQWALIGIRNQHPDITNAETNFRLAQRWLGKEIAEKLYTQNHKQIMNVELIKLAIKMGEIFEQISVPYLIGGSVASSILGEPRATLDIDIVADLKLSHIQFLLELMNGEFYIDETMIREAIENNSSFNVIHLDSMQKVDIFLLSSQPLAQEEMRRRQQLLITENPEKFAWLASAEDIVLQKLIWYRLGGNVSDRQWRDVLGVLKVQADKLDLNYLTKWAKTLELEELMLQALQQAGINYS